ncbi:MAG: ornithine cyclodeaminase family protein [Gammaproteobacteria bacterium]|nr:ornithine cyclodeaminase family protein [Gammaproteobacteria bacterium]MDH3409022.1 ornithine cyclodeaminase family protein [Gammaproteobacteria bacterium]
MELTIVDDAQVTALTPWPALIDAIREAFRRGGVSPVRHQHAIPGNDRKDITFLLMPAWNRDGDFGIKLATVAPSNAAYGRPTLHGAYVLFSGATGIPRAILDAGALTARRTAAASALASRYLSRADSKTLLMIGTGRVARQLIAAHCSVRPIEEVRIWGRSATHAQDAANVARRDTGISCVCVPDIETGASGAHIISSATPAETPLLQADWVGRGTHVDLVGAYKPTMCEADADLIGKADQVFVDTMEGAIDEAGDLIQAVQAGTFSFDDIAGDMYRMASRDVSLRHHSDEITLFKSVGTALQDLAAAQLCVQHV